MYKLCLALGWSVIKMQLQSAFLVDHIELLGKIKQHRFIISENINAYYADNARKEGLLTQYEDYMSSVLYTDQYIEIRDNCDDISKNISDYLKNKCSSIAVVIYENKELEIDRSSCKYQYSIEEASNDEKSPLKMYSVIAAFYADEGEDAITYIDWVKNLISGEKEISIIDPYILANHRNYNCLVDYYFPIIPDNCVLNLHVPNDSVFIDRVKEDALAANINIKIYKYTKVNHERHITTSSRVMNIGIGMDFMKKKNGNLVIRKGTNFSLLKKTKNLPYMEIEHKLAGVLE